MKKQIIVKDNTNLLNLLTENFSVLGKTKIKSLISDKNVKVNGVRTRDDLPLKPNDIVDVFVPESIMPDITVKVVYQDDNIVVVDKPPKVDSVTALPKLLKNEYGELFPAHRLDTNTTGLVILAKNAVALDALTQAFRQKQISKEYRATVVGKMPNDSGRLIGWLSKDETKGLVCVYDAKVNNGKEAVTDYKVISYDGELTELALFPKTGRTHQLRVQLAHIGRPILGDGKYGDFNANKRYNKSIQQLRAVRIKFDSMTGCLKYLNDKEIYIG